MLQIPHATLDELALHARAGSLADFGPLVYVSGATQNRQLPVSLPLITVGDYEAPDIDLNLGQLTDPEHRNTLYTTALNNPEASIVLAQLLRATETLPISAALTMESMAFSMLQSGAEFATWLGRRAAPPLAPDPADQSKTVTVQENGGVTQVRLTRPTRANYLNAHTRARLTEVFQSLTYTDGPITFSGEGKHFCAGGDIREFGSLSDPVTAHLVRTTGHLPAAVAAVAHRLEVSVHGACIGAGIELAAFAAKVVAHPDTIWRLPELQMGLLPGSGGTVSVPRRIGRHRTLQLTLDPAGIDTATALAWGLADEIAP